MEQRRLRPGDTIEDYCTRERRLTDHVVVAVVDDVVKQTRCSACDTEHPFKEARVPPRRKKPDLPATLRPRAQAEPDLDAPEPSPDPEPHPNLVMRPERKPSKSRRAAGPPVAPAASAPVEPPSAEPPNPELQASGSTPAPETGPEATPGADDEGPVHRRLIRATLPRPEGQAPSRPLPEFTIRQPSARHGSRASAPHSGKGAGKRGVTPWDRTNGSRPGAYSHGHAAPHGREKGRPHGPRHHKKSR